MYIYVFMSKLCRCWYPRNKRYRKCIYRYLSQYQWIYWWTKNILIPTSWNYENGYCWDCSCIPCSDWGIYGYRGWLWGNSQDSTQTDYLCPHWFFVSEYPKFCIYNLLSWKCEWRTWWCKWLVVHIWLIFWDTAGFEGIIGNLIAFLKVFIFGVAVLMFTWWLFNLILSAGDDEKKKKARNRVVYGIAGLIFIGFVDLWWGLVAEGDFANYIPTVAGTLFKLALFFAAPVVIFMLFYGAYYYITSAGDDERMKNENLLSSILVSQ